MLRTKGCNRNNAMLDHVLQTYGYWAVLVGAMIEGESIILTASALAWLGKLNIWYVGVVTFWGTLVADQAIYFLGAWYGPKTLGYLRNRFPKLQPHIARGLHFLKENETLYILSFRFIYGIRIVSPFIIGSQGISFLRFGSLNVVAALVWTVISCAVGYFMGAFLGQFTNNISLIIFGIVAIVIGLSLWVGRVKASKAARKQALKKDQAATPLHEKDADDFRA